jgi:hypothetical protein
MYKEEVWANKIIETQNDEGGWGYFHTLSEPKKNPITTEQALKRLENLGYTYEDGVICKAVEYMSKCINGVISIPDYREKHEHWDNFVNLMLATWIRRFTLEDESANNIAVKWSNIITVTFRSGSYSRSDYDDEYTATFSLKVNKQLSYEIRRFYNVSISVGQLDMVTEERFFDYIMSSEYGIYYVYNQPLKILPKVFKSKETSRYLAAIDLMADFHDQSHKLRYVSEWLENNRLDDGRWDMGKSIKDSIYFPLSDNWRREDCRIDDCTYYINRILKKISG